MPTWPATLPDFHFSGVSDQRMSAKVRSKVDAGPAIQRRRFTAAVRRIQEPIVLDFAQRQTFDAFYIDDLKEGTLSFTWTDPVTGNAVTIRFASDDGPAWSNSGPNWMTTLDLEILP